MPKFDLIQQGVTPPMPSPEPAPPKRSSRAQGNSKRATRKLSGFYLTPETVAKLKRHVLERQEAGERVDASDVVEEALVALLS